MNPEHLEVVHGRANPMIDPHLHVWGWEVPVYLFLGGLVAGLMVLLPALEWRLGRRSDSAVVRFAPWGAVVLLSLGMGALFLDLENKINVWRFYTSFQITSPMSWGSWILLGVYPVLLLLGLGALTAMDRDRIAARFGPLRAAWPLADWASENRGALLTTSVVLGLALGSYTGLLLGTLSARLAWNSAVLGPLFMVSGVSTGAALLLVVGLPEPEAGLVVRWDAVAIVAELALLGALLLSFASGGQAGQAAAALFLGGAWTPHFWALVVGAGLLTPLLMEVAELRAHLRPTIVAPALVLVGGFALRAILVAAGQETSFAMLAGGGS